jgi:nucleoside-diphosphate-sugar epimerase
MGSGRPSCSAGPGSGVEPGFASVVYASSAGVFGADDAGEPRPATHYEAFKLAVEGLGARLLERHPAPEHRISAVRGLWAGRETGVSAAPSLACRAAARGETYVIPFTGASGFMDDVAAAFEQALLTAAAGASVFNLVGEIATVSDVVAALCVRRAAADCAFFEPGLTGIDRREKTVLFLLGSGPVQRPESPGE